MSRTFLGGNSPDRAREQVRAMTEYSRSDLNAMEVAELDDVIAQYNISLPGFGHTKGQKVTAILSYFSASGQRI